MIARIALGLALAGAAVAVRADEGGEIRGGEHAGFSRIVMTIEPTTEWSLENGPGSVTIRFPGRRLAFQADGVFDRMPASRIRAVAAVLGVIKTMASIDQPPEILGKMIGGALVGTFLGVFLAYGIVGPFATRVKGVIDEDQQFYNLIREVMVAALHNHAPNVCVEVGRQNTPANRRPSYNELEGALRASKQSIAA